MAAYLGNTRKLSESNPYNNIDQNVAETTKDLNSNGDYVDETVKYVDVKTN